MITYKLLTENELDTFIQMRIAQLREECTFTESEVRTFSKAEAQTFTESEVCTFSKAEGREDIDLKPALLDYYHRHMADDTFVSWIALDDEKMIATSGMSIVEKPPYFGCPSGRIGLLSSMFTDKAYRRRGIARELLSRVVNEAKQRGCGVVQITASDMGVLLYTDFGFKKNGNFMQLGL